MPVYLFSVHLTKCNRVFRMNHCYGIMKWTNAQRIPWSDCLTLLWLWSKKSIKQTDGGIGRQESKPFSVVIGSPSFLELKGLMKLVRLSCTPITVAFLQVLTQEYWSLLHHQVDLVKREIHGSFHWHLTVSTKGHIEGFAGSKAEGTGTTIECFINRRRAVLQKTYHCHWLGPRFQQSVIIAEKAV